MKKPNYEFAVIADAVNKIALAHPEVRFTLRHDNRLIFQTTGKSNRLEILFQMFGRDAASKAEAFGSIQSRLQNQRLRAPAVRQPCVPNPIFTFA